jgi:hypothetical protein
MPNARGLWTPTAQVPAAWLSWIDWNSAWSLSRAGRIGVETPVWMIGGGLPLGRLRQPVPAF